MAGKRSGGGDIWENKNLCYGDSTQDILLRLISFCFYCFIITICATVLKSP